MKIANLTRVGEFSHLALVGLQPPTQFGSHNWDNSQCDECHIMPTFKI